ncbi:hypothetical protein GCM10010399_75480 [Dactylosporangium fulvum]|uniref:DNA-binding response regulator n=1 Tax=Dactylosporangium fulvum TaxID=53359 RepID=A0ABY5VPE8_9ACTN|nr:DNA-binding response regulator [Dactylosporangium fulvum]UWP79170.1 DNA-binding response regulator [Dactylosporangium fulvum]
MGRVAVVDPLPLFRAGVVAALQRDGHTVDTPEDLPGWLRASGPAVVLLTVQTAEDWTALAEVAALDSARVVAVLDELDTNSSIRAVNAGALSVVPRATSVDGVRRACQAAIEGESTLPRAVVRALAASAAANSVPDVGRPSEEQLSWLRQLAGGATVNQLATRAGYSERAMFRLLNGLYRTIGVRTRTEALMRAHERGWLR